MSAFILYNIKVALCLTVFYLPYTLLLRQKKLLHINRYALLIILAASFIMPLLPSIHIKQNDLTTVSILAQSTISNYMQQASGEPSGFTFSWAMAVMLIYIIGALTLFGIRVVQMIHLLHFMSSNLAWDKVTEEGIHIYCHKDETSPFSWFNNIVISESDAQSSSYEAMIAHEWAHIYYKHSYDNILVMFAEVLQWFNPVVWLLRSDLRDLHEYEADNHVLHNGTNMRDYQYFLVSKAFASNTYAVENGLLESSLKKRIGMMIRPKSTHWNSLRYVYLIPACLMAVVVFAKPDIEQTVKRKMVMAEKQIEQVVKESVEETTTLMPPKKQEPVQKKETNMPPPATGETETDADLDENYQMPVCGYDLQNYIARNIRIPEYARQNHINAIVFVSFTVASDGSIINPIVAHPTHPLLDEEALRLISEMPNWEPAKEGKKFLYDGKRKVSINFKTSDYQD